MVWVNKKQIGMSRSAFAKRFRKLTTLTALIGEFLFD